MSVEPTVKALVARAGENLHAFRLLLPLKESCHAYGSVVMQSDTYIEGEHTN